MSNLELGMAIGTTIVIVAVIVIMVIGRMREAKQEHDLAKLARGPGSLDIESKRSARKIASKPHTQPLGSPHKSHKGSTD